MHSKINHESNWHKQENHTGKHEQKKKRKEEHLKGYSTKINIELNQHVWQSQKPINFFTVGLLYCKVLMLFGLAPVWTPGLHVSDKELIV